MSTDSRPRCQSLRRWTLPIRHKIGLLDTCRSQVSTDTIGDTRLISRPILNRHIGRQSGEISTDTWSSVGRHVLQVGTPSVASIGRYLVDMSVYTRPTLRPLRYDELSAAYRSTVDGISVDIWWYIVYIVFVLLKYSEMSAFSSP